MFALEAEKLTVIDARTVGTQVQFSGLSYVERLADKQIGPTCGFEAIENIIQLFRREENDLTERYLIPRSDQLGFTQYDNRGPSLALQGYIPLLKDFNIPAQWYPFDHRQVIIPALRSNRGVLAVGDATFLNQQLYPAVGSWHAFILTNFYTDQSTNFIIGYVGIDSNIARAEVFWPLDSVGGALSTFSVIRKHPPVLLTDNPTTWKSTAKFYYQTALGNLLPAA
jgi:hypothetical protein